MGMVIAKNLKLFALRRSKGLTQIEASKKLGIPINVYARIEQGKSSGKIENWTRIQKFYGVSDEDMWKLIKGKLEV